jgi:energy-coupling factor transport system ATP-binding protein
MPDLRIDHLSFTYLDTPEPVLRGIDIAIPTGQFVLLAGPSGCGKSTLALALAGLIPTRIAGDIEGDIYLENKRISKMEINEISQYIGMVFQNPDNQLIQIDVESEVAFGPENLALPRAEIAERVEQSLAYTRMNTLAKQEIFALSGGQKQRVAISATLAMRPSILVLDEPTSDLDPVGTQEVLSVLRTLNKQYSMTIVLIEHKVDEVIPWVDRVLLMDKGRIVVDAAPRNAFNDIPLWDALGVSVPQIVRLARSIPDMFGNTTPLTVDEAYDVLAPTPLAQYLRERNNTLQHMDTLTVHVSPQHETRPVVAWENVGLAYGAKQVLKDINMNIATEEWVAIVGPNGSGKTSMASLAMGFQAPTSGAVRHNGRPVKAGSISLQAESIAYLFQAADTMLFSSTVEKEFLFGVKNRRKRKHELLFSVDTLLKTIDLEAHRQDNPFQLSHGQRKRLAIGVLLTRYPDVLILDEPTTGQDEGHAHAFLQFLEELRRDKNFTYIMISHDMQAVAKYATRVVVLHEGHIALDGPPEQVFAHVDQLAESNVLPPPIALLHARLCGPDVTQVALDVPSFLQMLEPVVGVRT